LTATPLADMLKKVKKADLSNKKKEITWKNAGKPINYVIANESHEFAKKIRIHKNERVDESQFWQEKLEDRLVNLQLNLHQFDKNDRGTILVSRCSLEVIMRLSDYFRFK
jgi:hypothetical protein